MTSLTSRSRRLPEAPPSPDDVRHPGASPATPGRFLPARLRRGDCENHCHRAIGTVRDPPKNGPRT
jgi:hypothetical protein